jgi:hypothetical protein
VRAFLACAKRDRRRNVLGARPEPRSVNLVLGSAVHEALAAYYQTLKAGREPDGAAVLATYGKAFGRGVLGDPPVLLDEDETLADVKQGGEALVQAFLSGVERPDRVLAVEAPFHADIIDPETGEVLEEQLTGYLDAVVQDGERTIVLEHKAAARAWSQDQLDFDLQVSLYQGVTGAEAVRLQVLTKTKVPKMLAHELVRTEREQQEAVGVVCQVLKAIRAGAFWPALGWSCKECEFRNRCRG